MNPVTDGTDGIDVLIERGPAESLAGLERHWKLRQTFAFIHEKSLAAAPWLNKMPTGIEGQLPPAYRVDHFCLLTSGSTGAPKLIIGRKSNAEDLARVLHVAQDSEPVRETIVSLPLTYCYAFVNQWLWSRTLNRKLIPTAGLRQARVVSRFSAACSGCHALPGGAASRHAARHVRRRALRRRDPAALRRRTISSGAAPRASGHVSQCRHLQ